MSENNNPNIPNNKFGVNNWKYLSIDIAPKNPGETSNTPNQAEVKLIKIDTITSKKVFGENSFIKEILIELTKRSTDYNLQKCMLGLL